FDTLLYVRQTCMGAELACNDDAPGHGMQSQVSVSLTQGEMVVIVVDAYGRDAGDYMLHVARSAATNTPAATQTPTPTTPSQPTDTPTPIPCVGDCDGDGSVSIDAILTLVNIALGNAQPSACPSGIPSGTQVDIALILEAVNNALSGCQP